MSQSTTFMLSRASQNRRFQRNQNFVRHSIVDRQLGVVAHTVIIVMLICVMGLMYLSQLNKASAFTYPINNLESSKDQLLAESQELKVEAARLGSLETIKNSTVAQNLTEPANIQTIR